MYNYIQFPFGAAANVFLPGITYTFRLTLTENNVPIYSEIRLHANSPPSSGTLVIVPSEGEALLTLHALAANNWVDDPEDYPLSYQFQYSVKPSLEDTYLLRTPMQISYTTALFSAGLENNNYTVYVTVSVIDAYDAFTDFTTEIHAREASDSNEKVRELLDGIVDSLNAFDVDSVLQTVNGVSLYLETVNCTSFGADMCQTAYNREPCSGTYLTCGPCLESTVGVFGDSNTMCHNASAVPLVYPGSSCDNLTTCAFGYCDDVTLECTAFTKVCPSSIADSVCSGHGTCEYSGVNDGDICAVTNNFCSAECRCDDGYSGSACQLDFNQSQTVESDRSSLCSALYSAASLQEASSTSLQTLVGPFLKAFDPSEISSIDTYNNCSAAFGEIMLLVQSGYLDDLPNEFRSSIATVLSNFAISLNSSGLNDMVISSLDSLIDSLLNNMLEGEDGIDLVTDAFQTSVTYVISSDLMNGEISPPSTLDGAYYGQSNQPSLTLPAEGLDACGSQSYTKMSVTKYSSNGNPFLNSNNTESGNNTENGNFLSNMLEFSIETPINGSSTVAVVDENGTEVSSFFTITQIFETAQNWTSDNKPALVRAVIDPDHAIDANTHLIFEISSCEVLQYTAFNVTYQCEDVSAALCSSQLSNRRRRTQAETGTTGGSGVALSFYTDVAVAVGDDAHEVLTSPISNLADSTMGLAFVSCVIFMTLAGYLFFAQWDHVEKMQHKYLRNAEERHVKVQKKHKSKENIVTVAFQRMNSYLFSSEKSLARQQSSFATQQSMDEDAGRAIAVEKSVLPFLDEVVGPLELFSVRDTWSKYLRILSTEHLWIRPFTFASSKLTRKIRYLGLTNEIMIIAFVDTLFFALFAPTQSDCDMVLEGDCIASSSPITSDGTLCKWVEDNTLDNGGYCDVNPPPESMLFFVVVAFIVTVVAVPFKILSYLLLEEVCALTPDSDSVQTYFAKSTYRMSDLGKVMECFEKEVSPLGDDHFSTDSYLFRAAKYYDVTSAEEEVNFILASARAYVAKFLANMSVPWESFSQSDMSASKPNTLADNSMHDEAYTQSIAHRRVNEMLRVLNLNDDGSAAQLTLYQRFRFGTHSRYLVSKIRGARRKADAIQDEFGRLSEGEQDLKDIMLIQHFILETLSPLQRFVIRKKFFNFDMQEPELINKWKWKLGWLLEWATMAFLCYYVLAWAAVVGDAIFKSWLIQFAFILLEDFFVTQVIRALLVHGLAVSYCKPQLLQIYHLLKRISVRKILRQDVAHNDVRVVQHFSGACRASRRDDLRELPAAQLLMKIDDNDMKLCNDVRRVRLTWLQVVLISIPLVFGFAGDQVQEFAFDMVINVVWGGILIVNALVLSVISAWYMIAFYLLVMLFVVYRAYRFYQNRNAKRKEKRRSRGELARFMSRRDKKTKLNFVSHLKVRTRSNALEISNQDLQWRNMNLRLQQSVRELDESSRLSGHALSVPDSIRSLSTLAPLLAAHYPPPPEEDFIENRPESWKRDTTIRSRYHSPRVAAFWEARRDAARSTQEHSLLYAQSREKFFQISGGDEYIVETDDVAELAVWVHSIKVEPADDDSSYSEIDEIVQALMSLMIHYENKLYLTAYLKWLVEEELLLDTSFKNVIQNESIMTKADIHNEIQYSDVKEDLSRVEIALMKRQVHQHRENGDIDLFAQITKELAALQNSKKSPRDQQSPKFEDDEVSFKSQSRSPAEQSPQRTAVRGVRSTRRKKEDKNKVRGVLNRTTAAFYRHSKPTKSDQK